MSDLAITVLPVTAIAGQRSAFKPLLSRGMRSAAPTDKADEYTRGLADGQQMAADAFEVDKSALLDLIASAHALKPEAGPEFSLLLRETVIGLMRQISENIQIDAAFLEAQIARAVTIMTDADEARQVVLHPDDAALVGNHVHSLAVKSDAGQPRGTVRIDCSHGWIEHGVALGIERLRELLESPA
jgi:flagellar assembly protein FliH